MNGFLQSYLRFINYIIQQSREVESAEFLQGQVPFDPLMDFIFYKVQKALGKNLKLLRVYTNLQYPSMHGDYHVDDGHITCLYMVNGEGAFEIKNESKIEFEEEKLILFDAKKPHKGNAPKKGNRITLAFKTEII